MYIELLHKAVFTQLAQLSYKKTPRERFLLAVVVNNLFLETCINRHLRQGKWNLNNNSYNLLQGIVHSLKRTKVIDDTALFRWVCWKSKSNQKTEYSIP